VLLASGGQVTMHDGLMVIDEVQQTLPFGDRLGARRGK
jgi:hypothetical protein